MNDLFNPVIVILIGCRKDTVFDRDLKWILMSGKIDNLTILRKVPISPYKQKKQYKILLFN